MSMLDCNLPYIVKEIDLLDKKIEIKSNSKYKIFVNNKYIISNNDILYSVVIEIPIKTLIKKEEKSFLFFKWKKSIYSYKNTYFEIPFSLLCGDLYACYYPKNYIENFNDKIIFNDIDITIDLLKDEKNSKEKLKNYFNLIKFKRDKDVITK